MYLGKRLYNNGYYHCTNYNVLLQTFLLTCHSYTYHLIVFINIIIIIITGSLADLESISEVVLATPNEGQFIT